ncbi:phenylacetate--CoA ligase family protein, partial [Flavobacterium sp.]|uniref:phenylacetate--CoA ligase family protein n=1 Tax=Flavobacterium sp. TaxID=239 RepID=UPI0037C10009
MKLFDLSLKLAGFPMKEAQKLLAEIRNVSAEDYQAFMEQKKWEIVNYHLKNNSSYQKRVGTITLKSWNDLPVMTKSEFQKPLSERLSYGFSVKDVYVNKTSGSSGHPFVFAKDTFSHAMTWANNIHKFGRFGIDFNASYQARFYGIPLDFIGNRKERFKDFLSNRFRFSIFDLSDTVLEGFLNEFRKRKFDYINGYTSSIVLFAQFLQQKKIVLTTICPTLKVCVVTSEMLFEDDKILLEKQLGVPIVNEYGASELDLIAFQSRSIAEESEWQVNSETLYVEILDDQNQPLPYGKEGKIVVTSLYNKAHPFIRYEIGDIGILDEKSTIKKPILKKLIGRTNDIALLPSGKKSPG